HGHRGQVDPQRRADPRPGVPGVVRIPHNGLVPNPASRICVAQKKSTGRAALRGTARILSVTAFLLPRRSARPRALLARPRAPRPPPSCARPRPAPAPVLRPPPSCAHPPRYVSACVSAAARAASGPASRRVRSPGSSSLGTPSATALSYLEPGLSPATTKSVFFDTEDATLPPRPVTASLASSRVRPASVPVITTVTPASGRASAPPPGR